MVVGAGRSGTCRDYDYEIQDCFCIFRSSSLAILIPHASCLSIHRIIITLILIAITAKQLPIRGLDSAASETQTRLPRPSINPNKQTPTSPFHHRKPPNMNIFESAFPQQGERATETSHRKIELQSPADLTYLVGKVSTAAREKLDKHLPPSADADASDPMRRKVEELVDDYVRSTFEMAKDGIAVNGMDGKEMRWEGWEQEGELIFPLHYV